MRFYMTSSLIAVALLAIGANGEILVTASRSYVDSKVYTLQTNMEDRIDNVQPGNYLAVSNNAMKALQTENDPTVPQWAKKSDKPSYTASEVGALPIGGIAVGAKFAERAGKVNWSGIDEKPDWIGNSKPEYTASEVDALPITGGTLAAKHVEKGAVLNISGAAGNLDDGMPEGGSVSISGGDSDVGGSVSIHGAYGTGGTLKIYPPSSGGLGNSYGIDIYPSANGIIGGFIKVNGTNVMDEINKKLSHEVITKTNINDLVENKTNPKSIVGRLTDEGVTISVSEGRLILEDSNRIIWECAPDEIISCYTNRMYRLSTCGFGSNTITFTNLTGVAKLIIQAPKEVYGKANDFVVYASVPENEECELSLEGFGRVFAKDSNAINALSPGLTVLYFTQFMSGGYYTMSRQMFKADVTQ